MLGHEPREGDPKALNTGLGEKNAGRESGSYQHTQSQSQGPGSEIMKEATGHSKGPE